MSPCLLWAPSLPTAALWHPVHCHTCQTFSWRRTCPASIHLLSVTMSDSSTIPVFLITSSAVMLPGYDILMVLRHQWNDGKHPTSCLWCWLSSCKSHRHRRLLACPLTYCMHSLMTVVIALDTHMLEHSCSFAAFKCAYLSPLLLCSSSSSQGRWSSHHTHLDRVGNGVGPAQ